MRTDQAISFYRSLTQLKDSHGTPNSVYMARRICYMRCFLDLDAYFHGLVSAREVENISSTYFSR